MNQVIAPSAVPTEAAHPVTFTGVRGDFRRLVTRGAMLELVTLGFYRFWLATDMRRHLWSHTSAGGDAPEYTGTAKELLIGFLFALAILVPIYLVYFFIGLEAELYQAFASVPLVVFFYLFYQFATYRARRYRLTRTVWRGVRFWMKGSGWAYALQAGLWMLLVVVTLGLALPWAQAALERYKMRNSFYGDLAGRFDAGGAGLFKQVWWLWLPFLPLMLFVYSAILFGFWAVFQPEVGAQAVGYVVPVSSTVQNPVVSTVYGTALPIWAVFGYAIYKAHEWRWWVSGIRFGEVRFESKLTAGALIGLCWKVIGWSLLILVVLIVWMGSVGGLAYWQFAEAAEAGAAIVQNPLVLGFIVLGYLICALAFGTVTRIYLRRDVWARVAVSSLVYNLSAADNVTARGEAVNALGEGFADSLDVGGF